MGTGHQQLDNRLPAMPVDRFVRAFDDFIVCLKSAIAEASANPAMMDSELLISWQKKALPVLEGCQGEIHVAAEAFACGDTGPIVRQADHQAGLSRNLDCFPLNFAGSQYEKKLDDLVTLVVVTSYRVCQAAGFA